MAFVSSLKIAPLLLLLSATQCASSRPIQTQSGTHARTLAQHTIEPEGGILSAKVGTGTKAVGAAMQAVGFSKRCTDVVMWWFGIIITLLGQTAMVAGLLIQKLSHNTPVAKQTTQAGLKKLSALWTVKDVATSGEEDTVANTDQEPEGEPPATDADLTDSDEDESVPNKDALDPEIVKMKAERKAKAKQQQLDQQQQENKPYYTRWLWVMGSIVWGSGHILCWLGLGAAPQSILACLQCWNIAVALVMAPPLLGESIPKNAIPHVLLLVSGCAAVIYTGPRAGSYTSISAEEFAKNLYDPICFLPCIFILSVTTMTYFARKPPPLLYLFCSASFAWYSATLSKVTSSLVVSSVNNGENMITGCYFYIFIAVFILFSAGQIHFMNLGLAASDAIVVIPVYEGLSMLGQIVFGGYVFREFVSYNPTHFLQFFMGVLCVLGALSLLSAGAYEGAGRDKKVKKTKGIAV